MEKTVTIVGGGPAGLLAGITLREQGIACKVFEKAIYPRRKLCGGMLTQKTVDLLKAHNLDLLVSDLSVFVSRDFQILNNGKLVAKIACDVPFYIIDRSQFDAWLADYYLELGGELHAGEKVLSVNFEEKTLSTDKGKYQYNILIASDGCNSLFTQGLNKKQPKALCLERDFDNVEIKSEYENTITLDVGLFKSGYGWCFPYGQGHRIGFGTVDYGSAAQLKRTFVSYLKSYGINKHDDKFEGAFVPYGLCDGIVSDTTGQTLIVGDAAGLVDPLTGEGIYYALKSGELAASAIANSNTYSLVEGEYCKRVKYIVEEIKRLQHYSKLFFSFRKPMCGLIKRYTSFVKFVCDEQVAYDKYGFRMFKMLINYLKEREL